MLEIVKSTSTSGSQDLKEEASLWGRIFCKNKETEGKILSSAAKCVFQWGKEEKNFQKLGSIADPAEVSRGGM